MLTRHAYTLTTSSGSGAVSTLTLTVLYSEGPLYTAITTIRVYTLWGLKRRIGMLLAILLIGSLSTSLAIAIWSDLKVIRETHQV